jgi:hypothetical protein
VLSDESGANQIIIVGKDNICLGFFFREHLSVMADGE